jgi:hypothetical protein
MTFTENLRCKNIIIIIIIINYLQLDWHPVAVVLTFCTKDCCLFAALKAAVQFLVSPFTLLVALAYVKLL